jgi:hypothetical protein
MPEWSRFSYGGRKLCGRHPRRKWGLQQYPQNITKHSCCETSVAEAIDTRLLRVDDRSKFVDANFPSPARSFVYSGSRLAR